MTTKIRSDSSAFNILFQISRPERREKKTEFKKQIASDQPGRVINDLMFEAVLRNVSYPQAEYLVDRIFVELTVDTYSFQGNYPSHVWKRNFLTAISLPTIQTFLLINLAIEDKKQYDLRRWGELPKFIYSYICRNPRMSQDEVIKNIQEEINNTYNGNYTVKAYFVNKIALSIITTIYYLQETALFPFTEPL